MLFVAMWFYDEIEITNLMSNKFIDFSSFFSFYENGID